MSLNWRNTCSAAPKMFLFAAQKSLCLGVLVCLAFSGQAKADLSNGDFEDPYTGTLPTARFIDQSFVPDWQTNAASGLIEIWSNDFNEVSAHDGTQHVELNSDQASTLFQDVVGIDAGLVVGFEFAHRAREGTDVMRLSILDLGMDNDDGGGDDTVLFTSEYSATTLDWEFNTSAGNAPIVALGNNIRFAYQAVSTGSGDLTQGNFLDAASFGVGVANVPEPSALSLLGLAGIGVCLRRSRSRV